MNLLFLQLASETKIYTTQYRNSNNNKASKSQISLFASLAVSFFERNIRLSSPRFPFFLPLWTPIEGEQQRITTQRPISLRIVTCNYDNKNKGISVSTHSQCDSPRNGDTQTPPFLQGLGEHDTIPATVRKIDQSPPSRCTFSSFFFFIHENFPNRKIFPISPPRSFARSYTFIV